MYSEYSIILIILILTIYTKGSAVFLARKILSSIDPMDVFYYNVCEVPVSNTASARVAKLDPEDELELNKTYRAEPKNAKVELSLKPNPNKGSFYIETKELEIKTLEVWSIEGKFIQRLHYHKGEEISLKDLEKGVYLLKAINTKGNSTLTKLIIQ